MNIVDFKEQLSSSKLSNEQVMNLYEGLAYADGYLASKELFNPKMTFKEVKDETTRLKTALIKLKESRGTEAAAMKSIRNTSSAITPAAVKQINMFFPDYYETVENIFENLISKILKNNYQISDLDKLVNCLNDFHNELKEVGKGGAKRQASYYKLGIIKLAEQFESTLPHLKASTQPDGLFQKYVYIWLNFRAEKSIKDPQRHLAAALKEYRAGQWKKIPLS